jgi:hypothetical protein
VFSLSSVSVPELPNVPVIDITRVFVVAAEPVVAVVQVLAVEENIATVNC